jgi:predicted HicB family RNase H-like nuclease
MTRVVNVSVELHKRAKVCAARFGLSLQELVRIALEKELAVRKGK